MKGKAKQQGGWMAQFKNEPFEALDRLLFSTAWLGDLQYNDPDEILYRLFHLAPADQREVLDKTLRSWFEKRWWTLPVDQSRWDEVLRDAFSAALRLDLEKTLAWLRAAYLDTRARAWLSSLRLGRPRDPEANLLRTLALSQTNRQLLPLWLRLCRLEEDQPLHYASLGLTGLYRLPDQDGQPHGDVPSVAFKGIVHMAEAFAARISPQDEAEVQWKNEVWAMMARFPRSEHYWSERFLPCLASQPRSPAARWLCRMLPRLKRLLQDPQPPNRPVIRAPTLQETRNLLRRLGGSPLEQLRPDLDELLDRYRRYAEWSGDGEFLVKTLTNLASKVLDSSPQWAQELTLDAFGWAPRDFKVWAIRAQSEAKAGDPLGAISLLWEAKRRMPEIPDVRTNLATLMRRHGQLQVAEMVYRQAVADFPANPVCRNGLAELLKGSGRLEEAESIYRQAVADFPRNAKSRSGLAGVLRAQKKWPEAESACRQGMADFPRNPFFASSLAAVLLAQGKLDLAEPVLVQAAQDFPSDPACLTGLAVLRLQQGKEAEGIDLLRRTAQRFPNDPVAGGFLRKLEKRNADIQALIRDDPLEVAAMDPQGIQEPVKASDLSEPGATVSESEPDYGRLAPSPLDNPAAAQTGLAGLYRLSARRSSNQQRREKLRKSLQFSQAVLKSDPSNLGALMEKAFSLIEQGEAQQAESLLAARVANGERRNVLGLKLGYLRARACQGRPAGTSDWQELAEEFPRRQTLIALERACQQIPARNGNGSVQGALTELLASMRGRLGSYPKSLQANEHWLRSAARRCVFPSLSARRTSLKKDEAAQAQQLLQQSAPLLQGVVEQTLANW